MNKPTTDYVSTKNKAKPMNVGLKSGTKASVNPTSGDGNVNAKMGHVSLEGAHGNRAKYSGIY